MLSFYITGKIDHAIPILYLKENQFSQWVSQQSTFIQNWIKTSYSQRPSLCLLPNAEGNLAEVICVEPPAGDFWRVGDLPFTLPEGTYQFIPSAELDIENLSLVWGLGAYQFSRYKKPTRAPAKLVLDPALSQSQLVALVTSIYQIRDWINTPTNDLRPSHLAEITADLARTYQASFTQYVGEQLLKENYPLIYAVGQGSDDAPRLLDLQWGNPAHPKVTLVGKGVCFDTGGLDIKNCSGMALMKKDMGGAAHVLGLAHLIMTANLPVRLRVLIPAVENAIDGRAYRPGDILKSRQGLSIEIGNTDAEGRLVLADALTEAVSDTPHLLIDIATLTGAARIALGTDVPVLFSNQDAVANAIVAQSQLAKDPIWQLPLYQPYRELLNSPIAEINNAGADFYAGAITAALFLKEFVPDTIPWVHLDVMAWNLKSRPGRPQGGEAMAIRTLWQYLQNWKVV